jgi:type II secretory pathway pseudopilin PulG
MLVSIVVVVLLIGAGVPLYNRWRKRKVLEEAKGQNLSFTKDAKSDPGKSDTTGGRKAA